MAGDGIREITLEEIVQARQVISEDVFRTPLVPLHFDWPGGQIYLKLENLQSTGSFKIRGASNAISKFKTETNVYTASAGNFAQGLAWNCSRRGIACDVLVPEHAPAVKTSAIERYGGKVTKIPYESWWNVIKTHTFPGMTGKFIHPALQPEVIAGNGTIGLEILEDLPNVDAVIIPYGGGGLTTGIASAIKPQKPDVTIYTAEVETAAPLAAAMKAGSPVNCDYTASFVDCIGSQCVLQDMWPTVQKLVHDSLVVNLEEICHAMRILAQRNCVIAEGGAAAPVAAAMQGMAGNGNIVCVISGGNIDHEKFGCILNGSIPK